jgi:4'-phosphopantetheinyl transferase EntD
LIKDMERQITTITNPNSPGGLDPALWHGLFGSEVHVVASGLCNGLRGLSRAERALVASAVPKREREFATGRLLARRLLAKLGYADFELLRDANRLPLWPTNVVGSISHTQNLCIVAVASTGDRMGLGVDVEPDEPVKAGLEKLVCRPREREWLLKAADGDESSRRCRAIFSAKEAVYKAFYPRLRERWGFQDVEVDIQFAKNRFLAQLPESADRSEIEGRIFRRDGWILSAVDYR